MAAELGDAHHRVGHRAAGGLQSWATGSIERFSLLLVNEGHAAFLKALLLEKCVIGLHEHIDDGVADPHHVKRGGGVGES